MRPVVLVVALTACGNDLPGLGSCELPPGPAAPELVQVPLFGQATSFDDLAYSRQLGRVIAAPQGTGRLYVIDPDTLETQVASVPGGTSSADADATQIYAADRGNDRIIVLDATTLESVGSIELGHNPDYVRVAPTAPEIWISMPGADRIEIYDAATLAGLDTIEIGGPEGLTFDQGGRAYTHSGGNAVVIDVASRSVVGKFDTGCGSSHGFPQADPARDIVIGGCGSSGGAGVIANGELVSGIEVGGSAAILAYDDARHHLYLRGDPGDTLDILGICSDGSMSVLAEVPISRCGHGAVADDKGHVWVCNEQTGGVQRITDPFAPAD
jgi:DNA-binding beta-propeller fold protein YncE